MEKVIDTINTLAAVAKEEHKAKGRGVPVKDRMAHQAYLDGLADAKAVVEDAMKPEEEPVEDATPGEGDGVQTETKTEA